MLKNTLQLLVNRLSRIIQAIPEKYYYVFIVIISVAVYIFSINIFLIAILVLSSLFIKKPFWGVVFLSLFIPVKAIIRDYFLENQLISQSITYIIPVIILFTIIGYLKNNSKYEVKNIDALLLIYILIGLLSSLINSSIYGFRIERLLEFFLYLQLIGFYLIGRFIKDRLDIFIITNLAIANIVSGLAILTISINDGLYRQWIESYELINFRLSGTLGNPNALAGYLLLIMIASLYTIKQKQYYISLFLPAVAFILTFSRGALVVAIVTGLIFLIKYKHYKEIVFGFFILILIYFVSPTSYQARISNIFNREHISYSQDSGRIWAAKNVFYINKNHYLLGNGFASYGGEYAYKDQSPTYLEGVQGGIVQVANTDNQWLQIYAQFGILGVTVWVYIIINIYLYGYKSNLIYSLLAFIILGIFIDTFQFYQISFFGFIALGLISSDHNSI